MLLFIIAFILILGESGFTFGSPALAANPVSPSGISLASLTTNAASSSSPFTEGLTLGETSASTGTSNTGFKFGGSSTQPTVSGFNFESTPLQGLTANATSSPFTEGLTPGKTSASAGASNTGFKFGGSPTQPPCGFNFSAAAGQCLTVNATSSPSTEEFTPGKTSASTGTSNTGFKFGGSSPQPTGVFNFGSAPLQGLTANATSSPFIEEFTPSETSANTGTSNSGFTVAGSSAQPTVGGFNFGSAPLRGFTLTGKTTAPAMVNPTPAFTPGGATTGASSASSGFTLTSDSVGSYPSSVLTLGATQATATTSSLFLGGRFKLGETTATPASTGFTTLGVPVVVSSSATPVTGSLPGLATTAVATATGTTASTCLTLGFTGASAVPGFSFPAASGFTFGATQTTMSLSTATTTGWFLFNC